MADIQTINLPDFGEFDDVEVIEVCVKEGQLVDKEEPIIVLETDKAAMEIPASVNGFIHKVLLKEGDKVKIGMPFLEIKIDPSTAKDDIKSNDLKDKKEELVPDEDNIDQEISYKEKKNFNKKKNTSIHSGPATRKLAREFGIDLNQITGSGPSNRILKEDLHNYVKNILNNTSANNIVSSKPNIDFSIWGSIKEEKLTKFKKTALDNLHSSWVNIPHVTQHDEADISDLLELRLKLNKKHKVKISPLAYIVKSTAESLKHFPEMNSSLSNDKELIIYKDYFNIGIAIDTDDGLIVPNIKNANEKSISEISIEITKLSELAILSAGIGYITMSTLMTATPISMNVTHGYSIFSTGIVIQAHVVGMFLPSLITGNLIKKYGHKYIIFFGIIILLSCLVTNFLFETYYGFLIGLILLGVGWNFLFVTGTSLLVISYNDEDRFLAQGINDFVVFSSQALGSLLAGFLLFLTSWQILNILCIPLIFLLLFFTLNTSLSKN